MSATVQIKERTGASGGPTDTSIDSTNSRYSLADSTISSATTNPLQIPNAGTNYSFWKSRFLNCTVTQDAATEAKAVSAGTLTASFAFLTGTNKVTMQVTPAGSLTETTYRISYTVINNSAQAITPL